MNPFLHRIFYSDDLWSFLNVFAGAVLGAAFYVLVKTQPYLLSRSYDPKYNAVYFARFVTGLVGGMILGYVLRPWLLSLSNVQGGGAALAPGLLALVGGYATEAVEQILQRLVDILLALVRGDGSAQAQAKASAAQAAKSADIRDLLPELESARGDNAKFTAALDKIRATLKK